MTLLIHLLLSVASAASSLKLPRAAAPYAKSYTLFNQPLKSACFCSDASDATTYVGAAGKVFNNVHHRILAYVCTVTGEKERVASILSHLGNQRRFGLDGILAAIYCATVANPLRSISAKAVSSISDPSNMVNPPGAHAFLNTALLRINQSGGGVIRETRSNSSRS